MAPRTHRISVPTTAHLPDTHRLSPTSSEVVKALSRLTRPSLTSITLEWLQERNIDRCKPYLSSDPEYNVEEEDDAPYSAAQSIEELRESWTELKTQKGGKREVVDRILQGDWRRGITLYQLAMVDSQHLLHHPNSLRWAALRLAKITSTSKEILHDTDSNPLPRFNGKVFLRNMAREIAPVTKAHFYITRLKSLPLTLLRIHLHDSPYNTQSSLRTKTTPSSSSTAIFIAFPDGSPHVYVSLAASAAGGDGRSLRKVVIEAIPKALSQPQARYTLYPTSLSARSLQALLALRGPGRSSAAQGGWSIFADNSFEGDALDYRIPALKPPQESLTKDVDPEEDKENTNSADPKANQKRARGLNGSEDPSVQKRRKLVAAARFGTSALADDGKGLDRLDVRIEDPFDPDIGIPLPGDVEGDEWKPDVRLSFHGAHVFAGIRKLVEAGVVDGEKMPGWMTGEAGVSVGVVRDGRIKAREGREGKVS
ncbi:CHL4-domain-containing protein [Patellaria atrata CBS 101060]|uniref:CHL4-domain-containing protein n=1 Tax=Patellaria atrata CBS 101060 TaxID=1346257 RepID=A0A9P4SFF6_9PEZI|nr:CHL4-domain-containing protein [Patellaria atrata CBS 101060]